MEAMADGLSLMLRPESLIWIGIGIIVGSIIAAIPGLGGLFAAAVMLPFIFQLDAGPALALLMAISGVAGTANTVTSCLFGTPGSPTSVATVLDGYPMAKRGEGARAVSAGVTSSAIGGVIGAIALGLSLPIIRPIVLAISSPEFFMLIIFAVVLMAFVGREDNWKALASAGLGFLLSMIGLERSTATPRFTFDSLYLFDGLRLVPVMLGMFAIAEMLILMSKGGGPIASSGSLQGIGVGLRKGMIDPFRYWRATLQSSIVGLWVGLAPGLGDSGAQFIAYSQVARSSPRRANFGKGEVEGVIAADACTNSTSGSALIPTLAFGIPGSASMAIVLSALLVLGIQPGSDMLVNNADLVWLMLWTLIVANIGGALVAIAMTSVLARLTAVSGARLAGPILIIGLLGSYATTRHVGDIIVAGIFGALGYAMHRYNYSRVLLLIGFVLGSLLERFYLLSMRTFGTAFLLRPITLLIFLGTIVVAAQPLIPPLASVKTWIGLRSETYGTKRDGDK